MERRIRIENPFALKVGQVFTGFGIGCGLGIGIGRPLNVGAIPVLQEVTNAARGATDVFSGVGRHVNGSLRSLGAKNVQVGIGCGVGFGHGFGVGLAIKPGVIHQIQSCFAQALAKVMMKFGALPGLPVGQNILPASVKSSMSMANGSFMQNPIGHVTPSALTTAEITPQGQSRKGSLDLGSTYTNLASRESSLDTSFGSRTEKVINGFLQNPLLKDEKDTELNESSGRLKSENNVLQMIIEMLTEENEKLRKILIEELKVPPSKLQVGSKSGAEIHSPCADCFECRRRQRKLR
ncbi:hypothetical protein AQUCO_01300839v1 [Aquilegia coerulea]|uniref:Uncharacterized protein n=1 Tax=Aquilegia coerulea TaxID=218851 RepID=A0A2G5E3P7_AQUCA|nr:hypothetical protein AQUCO_01300839v1 [Aquilegia coerulea]